MTDSAKRTTAETVLIGGVAGFATCLPLSIAAAQILLVISILAAFAAQKRPRTSPLLYPAAAYSLATLVSASLSPEPLISLADTKELLLYVILLLVPVAVSCEAVARLVRDAFLAGSAVSGSIALFSYILTPGGLENRTTGTFHHYMTLGGLLMLAAVAAASELLSTSSNRRRVVMAALLLIYVTALGASYTRNAWLGLLAGVVVVTLLTRPRLVALVAVGAVVIVLVAPSDVRDRMLSINFAANQDRVEMYEVGVSMVGVNPLFGVGPNRIPAAYADFPLARVQPHLHNNLLQIAAERGLPAVGMWLWLIGTVMALALRGWRRDRRCWRYTTAVGAVVALFIAGLFEYNYGDSEVRMAFLLLASLAAALPPDSSNQAATRSPHQLVTPLVQVTVLEVEALPRPCEGSLELPPRRDEIDPLILAKPAKSALGTGEIPTFFLERW